MIATLCESTRERIASAVRAYRSAHGSVPLPVARLDRRLLVDEDHSIDTLEAAIAAVEHRHEAPVYDEHGFHLAFVLGEAIWEARRVPARGGRSRW